MEKLVLLLLMFFIAVYYFIGKVYKTVKPFQREAVKQQQMLLNTEELTKYLEKQQYKRKQYSSDRYRNRGNW